MDMTCQVSTAGINEQVRRAYIASPKTLSQVVNQRSLNVAGRAFNATPMVAKSRIEYELGQIGNALKTTKAGKLRNAGKIYVKGFGGDVPRLALIINARRRKAGKPGLEGKEMAAAIRKTLGARKRSVGFEKIGWMPALKLLASKLISPFKIARTRGIAVYGKAKGAASPASFAWNPTATITNSAKGIQKAGTAALQHGIAEESVEIRRHLGDDLQPIADAFNRK